MHRPVTLIGFAVAALVLGAAPAAQAAASNNEHFAHTESFTEPDFCGTGQAVELTISARGIRFPAPNQPNVDFAQNTFVTVTWVAESGATVIGHTAHRFTVGTISGDPAGIHVDEGSNIGAMLFRLDHGGVLIMNAGVITMTETFDGEEFLSGEITVNNGPHPSFEDDALFCDVIPTALGL